MHGTDGRDDGTHLLADPSDARSNCGVGVVVDLDGGQSHRVLADALAVLSNLEHRGTTGAEPNTGDGAGALIQTPESFFAAVFDGLPDEYAVGSLFLPRDPAERESVVETVEATLADYGLAVDGWRAVPTDNTDLGETALDAEPHPAQALVRPAGCDDFERALYVGRQAAEAAVDHDRFYVCSLDPDTVVYKGLLTGEQLADYYPDLTDDRVETGFALVHARFSTNTLGAWHLAHPYRTIVHNGEFNTIDGNVNWMRAREADLRAEGFTDDELDTVLPVIDDPEQSDTASVDNALELLLQTGRSLPHALRLLVPEAWQGDEEMSAARRDFYDYHASLVEPWDGPALVVGTDGDRVGAVLDRNGLRPCRYEVRSDGTLVMASEQGALESDASEVRERGRLQPGELFLAEPGRGVVDDEAVFADLTDDRYGEWVADEQVRLATDDGDLLPSDPTADLRAAQAMFGYTEDELDELVEPMAADGHDPVGSMGDDAPLAGVSEFDLPLASYFRQLFAQVTNPPIDYLREDLVTSLETRLGRQRNLLAESRAHARQVVLDSPVLTDATLDAVRHAGRPTERIDLSFDPDATLETAIERVQAAAATAVENGAELLVLSQRSAGADALPVPSLLATGAVHHHLVREGLRARVGLVVEAGDIRTVHQLAATVGYGAGAVNPYLAIQSVRDLVAGADGPAADEAVAAYVGALEDGLLKVQSKMGISTVESYRGAQIFEAVGLDESVVDRFFEGTPNRTGGATLADLEADVRARHEAGFGESDDAAAAGVERVGEFENRTNGRFHQWNPDTVHSLQEAVERGDYEAFGEYAGHVNDTTEQGGALRGLLDIDTDDRESVPIEAVEPVEDIVERFSTAAMSLGSISPEAHETNAEATNELGAKSNTGERFDTDRECAIKQVASGRFGVTSTYLGAADDLQIKMAQGSKPGEGGHLPGSKVNEMIADVRCSTPGVGLISPPPQHDIYSIEDLKQLIADLRAANPDARVHVKLVAEAGIGTVAAGCAKAGADCIHVSGHSGGTGASPKTSIKHAGLPWELGLAEANQLLRETGLRSRVTLRVDGGLKTGRDVAVAALLGAEEFAFGTASLVSAGCVMARICHTNDCPTGVATQDPDLRQRYRGTPERVANYLRFVARGLREITASLGYESVDDLVGRVGHLAQTDHDGGRAARLDLSRLLAEPSADADDRIRTRGQDAPDMSLDESLIAAAGPALAGDGSVSLSRDIDTSDRSVGARLSHAVTSDHGTGGLPDDSVRVSLDGAAGQSFGAFLASGVTLSLTGAANDYVGKGLSGGTVAVQTPPDAGFDPAENTVVGNVALYGATDGECYVNGVAGERFAVRNSGAAAVVEGVGDHGCEYMTGGIVAVLGDVGRNFAAGMSGGVAYVYDPDGDFAERCNTGMVRVSRDLCERDEAALRRLVENHAARTDSRRAADLLADWPAAVSAFAVVMPDAYRAVIDERPEADARRSLPASARDDPSVPGSAD